MAIRLVKTEVLPLSKKLYDKHWGLPAVPGERDLKPQRLGWHRTLLEKKKFSRCDWAWGKCKENSKVYRGNGQHTGTVLGEVLSGELEGVEFPTDIPVTLQHWEIDTIAELGDWFDQFDPHRAVRTPEDRTGIYMAMHEDFQGGVVTKKFCGKILGGVAWASARGRNLKEVEEVIPPHLVPKETYYRGMLLAADQVRAFVLLMCEYEGIGTATRWMGKPGAVGKVFHAYLCLEEDVFKVLLEQLLYGIGEDAEKLNRWLTNVANKKGFKPGIWFLKTGDYFKGAEKKWTLADEEGREQIKALIRQVIEEGREAEKVEPDALVDEDESDEDE
jgi:hypothetical protein